VTLPSPPVSVSPESEPGPPPSDGTVGRALDVALRVAGGLLAATAAVLTGLLELLFATVRIDGHLIGVSVLLAVGANIGLSWFADRAVGGRWAVALPAVPWFALMVLAAGGTAEGDIGLAGNNWVGLVTIAVGSMVFAGMAYRRILPANTDRHR
jgi:hypothetical protein